MSVNPAEKGQTVVGKCFIPVVGYFEEDKHWVELIFVDFGKDVSIVEHFVELLDPNPFVEHIHFLLVVWLKLMVLFVVSQLQVQFCLRFLCYVELTQVQVHLQNVLEQFGDLRHPDVVLVIQNDIKDLGSQDFASDKHINFRFV